MGMAEGGRSSGAGATRSGRPRTRRRWAALALLGLAALACVGRAAADRPGSLREQLRALAVEHQFSIDGIETILDEPAREAIGPPIAQLRTLLAGYNHVVVAGGPRGVERVLVTGAKRATPSAMTVQTVRRGTHHAVRAVLTGPGGRRETVELLLDTGASTVVLPSSMIATLGFDPDELEPQVASTANGEVDGLLGLLASVRVGPALARDVEVFFIADDRLGGHRLLGMSFLERFRFTVDDAGGRLLLGAR